MRSLATKASVASKARSKISRSSGSNWCRSDILHSDPKTLSETKAGTIEHGGHHPVAVLKRTQQHFSLLVE